MQSEGAGPLLGGLVSLVRGNTYKSALLGLPGPVLLGLASIQRDGGFRGDSLKTYGGESASKLLLSPGDLYVSLKDVTQSGDLLGAVARLPKGIPVGRLTQDTVKLVFDAAKYPPSLLFWSLRTPEYRSFCRERAIGTTNLSLSREDFLAFQLPVVTKARMELVELLESTEHRIDLLRQTNATLEAIAQALFKSWFIDFDPVRAKAEGREPEGMDAATAALFPAELEESAIGLIPKGWTPGRFGDLAELARGAVNPLNSPDDEFEHYSLPAFDAGQLPVLERGTAIRSNKTRVPAGAVLQSKLNPHIPRVWLPSNVGERAVCSTEFLPWVARGVASREIIFCTLTGSTFEAAVRTLVTGTSNSHQRVKPDQIAALATVVPSGAVSQAFTQVVRPLLNKHGDNRLLAKTLTDLRDNLLPRLISGRLRLPEVPEAAGTI